MHTHCAKASNPLPGFHAAPNFILTGRPKHPELFRPAPKPSAGDFLIRPGTPAEGNAQQERLCVRLPARLSSPPENQPVLHRTDIIGAAKRRNDSRHEKGGVRFCRRWDGMKIHGVIGME